MTIGTQSSVGLTRERPKRSAPSPVGRFVRAVYVVFPAWVAARTGVAVALVIAHRIVAHVGPANPAAVRVHQGLLGWDAGWYQSIAIHGYVASGLQSLRFFPAFPLAGRGLGWLSGIGPGVALVIVSNVCALAAMAVLWLLVERDFGDRDLARRSVWLLALAPSAFTLVMGYAEAALLLTATATLLSIRTGRWGWAALAGVVAGMVRPLGLLLMIPVVIEVYRSKGGRRSVGTVVARLAAVVAPAIGVGTYLAWVRMSFGDPWLPFRVQDQAGHRGTITSPFSSMWNNVASAVHGQHVGSALHIAWVIVSLVLVVVVFRRLPFSYGAFAAGVVVLSVATSNLDSFERYALSGFPLVIAASTLTSRPGVERVVLVLAGLSMVGYAVLAFLGISVP